MALREYIRTEGGEVLKVQKLISAYPPPDKIEVDGKEYYLTISLPARTALQWASAAGTPPPPKRK